MMILILPLVLAFSSAQAGEYEDREAVATVAKHTLYRKDMNDIKSFS